MMMENIERFVREIETKNLLFSWLCKETISCYNSGNYFAAFMTLSTLSEQVIREKADSTDGNLSDAIILLETSGKLSHEHAALLDDLFLKRENAVFYMYSSNMVLGKDEYLYSYADEETWEYFMKGNIEIILEVVADLAKFLRVHI